MSDMLFLKTSDSESAFSEIEKNLSKQTIDFILKECKSGNTLFLETKLSNIANKKKENNLPKKAWKNMLFLSVIMLPLLYESIRFGFSYFYSVFVKMENDTRGLLLAFTFVIEVLFFILYNYAFDSLDYRQLETESINKKYAYSCAEELYSTATLFLPVFLFTLFSSFLCGCDTKNLCDIYSLIYIVFSCWFAYKMSFLYHDSKYNLNRYSGEKLNKTIKRRSVVRKILWVLFIVIIIPLVYFFGVNVIGK